MALLESGLARVDPPPPETELLRGARVAAMAAERAAVDQPNLWWFHQRAIQVRGSERQLPT